MANKQCLLIMQHKTERRNINSLHILKAICAILVIDHHSYIFGQEYIAPFRVMMVPCFFMITGFFLFQGNIQSEFHKVKRYCLKTICLLIAFGLFYDIPYILFQSRDFSLRLHIENLLTGIPICFVMWYLASLYQGLIITHSICRISRKLLFIFPAIYIIFRTSNTLYLHIPFHANTFESALLDLANSTCFLSLGYLTAFYYKKISTNRLIYITGIVISYFYLFISTNDEILRAYRSIAIITMSASFFLLFLHSKDISCKYLVELGKKHSANLYFFHVATLILLTNFVEKYGLENIYALIIFIFTLFISYLVNFANHCWKRLLNKFYPSSPDSPTNRESAEP